MGAVRGWTDTHGRRVTGILRHWCCSMIPGGTVTGGAGPFRPGSMAAAFDLTMILCPESLSRFFLVVLSPADPLIGASAPAVSVGPL